MLGVFHLDVKLLGVHVATLVQGDAVDSPIVAVQDAARLAPVVRRRVVERHDVRVWVEARGRIGTHRS